MLISLSTDCFIVQRHSSYAIDLNRVLLTKSPGNGDVVSYLLAVNSDVAKCLG